MVKEVIQLYSGGVDSSACIKFLLEEGMVVRPVFVDFGQAAADKERGACRLICNQLELNLEEINLRGLGLFDGGVIEGRNQFLISLAVLKANIKTTYISIGIHSGTDYLDCGDEFLVKMQELLTHTTRTNLILIAPFLKWKKHEIWQYAKTQDLPMDQLVSCEKGTLGICGKCPSCLERHFLESYEK